MDLDENYVKKLLPKRPEDSHKGTFGSVLNVAGSSFYTGAAYFSSVAPLKVGCGKSTLISEENVLKAIASLSPDAILMPLNKINKETIKKFRAISMGCGFSQELNAIKIFKKVIKLLKDVQTPLVIDADGLNILSSLQKTNLPINTILTPHPKELSRLMSVNVNEILAQPEHWAKECCKKYNCTTVLKLHKTIVADIKGNIYVNKTGNSALSHGGSGDVLCGMISGFLAQGLNCFDASCLAVYLHGKASEIASKELTEYSTLASDLLDYIPKAIKTIL